MFACINARNFLSLREALKDAGKELRVPRTAPPPRGVGTLRLVRLGCAPIIRASNFASSIGIEVRRGSSTVGFHKLFQAFTIIWRVYPMQKT